MKRIGLITLAFFLVTQIFLTNQSFAQQKDSKLELFSNQTMDKIKNDDFENLFSDFYLPKEYTEKDTQNDKEAVTVGLKELIQNEMGLLENFSSIDSVTEKLITLNIATGSPETTGNLPSTNLFYKAMFTKFGDGYVAIGIYKEGEKLFIKNITFGLPASSPKSIEIAQDFGRFMMNIATEQQKRNTSSTLQ